MTSSRAICAVVALLFCASLSAQVDFGRTAHVHSEPGVTEESAYKWVDNYTLIVTDAKTILEAYEIQYAIEDRGGSIAVIFPNRVMLGWVPQEAANDLVGKHGIQYISRRPLRRMQRDELTQRRAFGTEERLGIRFFNHVATGRFMEDVERGKLNPQKAGRRTGPDGFEAPPLDYEDYRANLLAKGITEDMMAKAGISVVQTKEGGFAPSPGNSDYLAGHVYFFLMYVESDGTGDPNVYNWNSTYKNNVFNEVVSGLTWMANIAKVFQGYDTQLTWVYGTGHCNQPYEPILRPGPAHDFLWINDCMADRGFNVGNEFARTIAFNTANRISKNTNWATVSFVVGPPPAPSSFTDGTFAYAYIRGPYSQLTYGNNGWGITRYDRVNAHETGHLFGAYDEYAASGCNWNRKSNNVYNGNCVNDNIYAGQCLMNFNDFAMCGYTPGQLGWKPLVSNFKLFTRTTDTGVNKQTFVPGEAIQYRIEYCVRGPRMLPSAVNPDGLNTVRMRVDSEFLTGGLDARGNTRYDSGWVSWTGVNPPTSTGISCWWTSFNTSIPGTAGYGQATATVQVAIEGIGSAAKPKNSKFFIVPGAATTQPSPPLVLSGPAGAADAFEVLEVSGGPLAAPLE